jgi:hypothetical protein
MKTKTVYMITNGAETVAYEDQVTADLYNMPAKTTEIEPPTFDENTQTCEFVDDTWVLTDIPEEEGEEGEEEYVLTWSDNRQAEYPNTNELVVALYDTEDKEAIVAKRAAVKAKYPKS